jgi:predicted phage-related endonuclease
VQLGLWTELLNRQWYERTTGQVVRGVQSWVRHPVIRWMAATLDGIVESNGALFEAKFMLSWSFSEEAAAEKHMAQLQHNMWVINARAAVLSIITGGGKWVEIKISADSSASSGPPRRVIPDGLSGMPRCPADLISCARASVAMKSRLSNPPQ